MIRTLIVDDEHLSRLTLSKLLEIYCPSVEIIGQAVNAAEAAILVKSLMPDLVFLDVAMPGKNGLVFLQELSKINFEVIFVTAHDKYVLQAIRLAAVDYLQKPVEEQLLIAAVANAAKRIFQKETGRQMETFLHNLKHQMGSKPMQLCLPSVKGFQVVELTNIIYCEAENTYTNFHFTDGKSILASRPLLDYDLMLEDSLFFRVHKSFLVNMQHIKEYQKGEGGFVILSNGITVEVSRRKKEAFIFKMKEVYKF